MLLNSYQKFGTVSDHFHNFFRNNIWQFPPVNKHLDGDYSKVFWVILDTSRKKWFDKPHHRSVKRSRYGSTPDQGDAPCAFEFSRWFAQIKSTCCPNAWTDQICDFTHLSENQIVHPKTIRPHLELQPHWSISSTRALCTRPCPQHKRLFSAV